MEKQQVQDQVNEGVDKMKAILTDPATPPAHKSVLAIILKVILRFLPVLVDIFHHASSLPAPAVDADPNLLPKSSEAVASL